MSALGEYMTEPSTGLPNLTGLSEYFTEPVSGVGEYVETARTGAMQASAGLGATVRAPMSMSMSPMPPMPTVGRTLSRVSAVSPLLGALGDVATAVETQKTATATGQQVIPTETIGAVLAAAMIGLAIRGTAGWFVGKAVAPDAEREVKYAWWGVAASILGGTLGLGIEAFVALNARDGE